MDLVTLAEYRNYAGIISTNDDAIITTLIPKVSNLIKTICRRSFVDYVNDAKVEIHKGGYGATIQLKEYPVISINSFEYSTDYGATYTELTEFTDYVVDYESGVIEAIGGDFPRLLNGYKISYTAGYETLPEDLKLAALDLISYYLKNDMAVHSPKAPGTNSVQIEYASSVPLPAHIMRILYLYMASYD